ncbi:unnamed protein product, partial [Tetraodon nigroviridis]
ESTGCQTQVSGLVSGLVLLLVLLLIAPLFYSLQKCVLAVIIVVNLRGALQKFTDLPRMWRVNRLDAAVWLVTMATSALVNTELGLLVGVMASALCVLGRTQRAQVRELGRTKAGELYEELAEYGGLQTHPGVLVCRYAAPIYYANQSLFKASLYRRAGLDPVQERGPAPPVPEAEPAAAGGGRSSGAGGGRRRRDPGDLSPLLPQPGHRLQRRPLPGHRRGWRRSKEVRKRLRRRGDPGGAGPGAARRCWTTCRGGATSPRPAQRDWSSSAPRRRPPRPRAAPLPTATVTANAKEMPNVARLPTVSQATPRPVFPLSGSSPLTCSTGRWAAASFSTQPGLQQEPMFAE